MFLRLIVLLATIALTGCNSMTVVQSVPAGRASSCDARLVGTWRTGEWALYGAEDQPADDEQDATYLMITPRRKILNVRTHRAPSDLRGVGKFSFLVGAESSYIFLAGRIPGEDEEISGIEGKPWSSGVQLVRYVVDGDRVRVFSTNTARVVNLIKSGAIKGRTKISAIEEPADPADAEDPEDADDPENAASMIANLNFVTGSKEEIVALLQQHPDIFHASPAGIFKRFKGPPPLEVDDED